MKVNSDLIWISKFVIIKKCQCCLDGGNGNKGCGGVGNGNICQAYGTNTGNIGADPCIFVGNGTKINTDSLVSNFFNLLFN